MTISLGLNISSLKSQRQLARSSDELSNVFTRLSSGQRINKASDDAAGLAIAESLNADSRVYNQGVRNLNDGISALMIADSALAELSTITTRLVELAEQSANGVFSGTQRDALNGEAQSLKAEYFRIIQSTEFNSKKVLTAAGSELRLQAGYGIDGGINASTGGVVGDGTFEAASILSTTSNPLSIASSDLNGDGFVDLVVGVSGGVNIFLGSGNGSFAAASSFSPVGTPYDLVLDDFNGDGVIDLATAPAGINIFNVALGNGDGSFGATTSYATGPGPESMTSGDFNGDGILDLVSADYDDDTVSLLLGNGDGSFGVVTSFYVGGSPSAVLSGDFNGDGLLDLVTADSSGGGASMLFGDGNGSFSAASGILVGGSAYELTSGDVNGDGILDLITTNVSTDTVGVLVGVGDGSFNALTSYAVGNNPYSVSANDLNGDGILDIISANFLDDTVSILLGKGDGTFSISGSFSTGNAPMAMTTGDFDGDGVLDLITANNAGGNISLLVGSTTTGTAPLLDFSLETQADARQALSMLSRKLDQTSAQRGEIGAYLSRIEVASNVLQVASENSLAAESRIRDADIAQESANLVRLQILQQAASSVLGQANQQPQLVLQLLRGNA